MKINELIKHLERVKSYRGNIEVLVGCYADTDGSRHDSNLEHLLVDENTVRLLSDCDHMEEIE